MLAPIKKLLHRARIRASGIPVTDGRREEFDEAAAGTLALGRDRAGNDSRPARIGAGGGTMRSVKTMGSLAVRAGSSTSPIILHKGGYDWLNGDDLVNPAWVILIFLIWPTSRCV